MGMQRSAVKVVPTGVVLGGWKGDLTHEYTPFMASLDRFVDLQKSEFMGKAALLKEHNSGPRERFVPLLLEDTGTADAPYCSSAWQGKEIVGLVGSGGYGHSIGKSIALAYVRTDLAKPGVALDVEVLGERRRPVFGLDPSSPFVDDGLLGHYETQDSGKESERDVC